MPPAYIAKTLNERGEKQFELCNALALDLPLLERESEHNLSATPGGTFEWLGVVGTFKVFSRRTGKLRAKRVGERTTPYSRNK